MKTKDMIVKLKNAPSVFPIYKEKISGIRYKFFVNVNDMVVNCIYYIPEWKIKNALDNGKTPTISFCFIAEDGTEKQIINSSSGLGSYFYVSYKNDTQLSLYDGKNTYYNLDLSDKSTANNIIITVNNNNSYLYIHNTNEYIPTGDYNPSTKKYVDDSIKALEDTNKYKLITCDDPLVINKTDITDIADATVTIDNLTGQYGNLTANENGTWTYTLNGFMNGLEIFTFKVGKTTQDLVLVPYSEMLYNDNNAGIVYTGTWTTEENTNYYNSSAHVSTEEGSTAIFTFTGTGVDIYSRSNPDFAGVIVARITGNRKDGTKVPAQTLIIDNSSESGDYYQIPTLLFNNLDYGTYKVKITVSVNSENNHSTYYLDGIRVYNPLDNMNLKINSLYKLKDKVNNVLYTDRGNSKFIPTKEYDPATKVYVDDLVNSNKINMCTDEEFDSMLTSKLVVSEDNDDLVFLQELPIFS